MAAHPEAVFQIYTNGTLVTEQLADKLQTCGKGNFQTVVRAMDLLKDRGVLFGVSLTATSRNLDSMLDPSTTS